MELVDWCCRGLQHLASAEARRHSEWKGEGGEGGEGGERRMHWLVGAAEKRWTRKPQQQQT